jgi:hypothetical protein
MLRYPNLFKFPYQQKSTPLEIEPVTKDGFEVMAEVKSHSSHLENSYIKLPFLKKEIALAEPWGKLFN